MLKTQQITTAAGGFAPQAAAKQRRRANQKQQPQPQQQQASSSAERQSDSENQEQLIVADGQPPAFKMSTSSGGGSGNSSEIDASKQQQPPLKSKPSRRKNLHLEANISNSSVGAAAAERPKEFESDAVSGQHLRLEDGEQDLVPSEEIILAGQLAADAANAAAAAAADKTKAAEAADQTTEATAAEQVKPFKTELVWTNIVLFVILHSCLPIGVYLLVTEWPWRTLLFSIFGMYASGLGVTGGSHRLWSHRSYKARAPVQLLLMALQTMAGQNSIYTWSRDHRVHHKFSETNADPHNIKRGFFFAHMGWLCCKKHPDVKAKGKLIDMSDLEANPYVMFQHRHFWWLSVVFTVLLPTMLPVWLWGEKFWTSFVFSFMVRYLITLHGTWLVNSAAHYYGSRPYDKRIEARESPYVIYNGLGEGFHNYHHTFPYDYATSEFGKYLNITTTFIDACAALGLVHSRRKVDRESIARRRQRTGEPLASCAEETEEAEHAEHAEQEGRPLAGEGSPDSARSFPARLSSNLNSSSNSSSNSNSAETPGELKRRATAAGPLEQKANANAEQEQQQLQQQQQQQQLQLQPTVGQSLANCGRLLVDNWRLSSAAVVQDSAQQSSLISMIHA